MNASTQSKRPALKLHVNAAPRLCASRQGVHLATDGGAVVDAFGLDVHMLVGRLKLEHDRIIAADPGEGPDTLQTIPDDCPRDLMAQAFKVLKEQGWDVWPGALKNDRAIYLGYSGA